MIPANTRTARFRDWALMALSSANLSIGLVLLALRVPFGTLIDRSLADAGWPSSLTLVALLLATSVALGIAFSAVRPPLPSRPENGV